MRTPLCFASLLALGCGASAASTDGAPVDAGEVDAAPIDALPVDAAAFAPAPHAPFPLMSDGKGHPLSPLRLVLLVTPSDPFAASLYAFGDALVTSAWWSAIGGEYGVGPARPAVHVASAPFATSAPQTKSDLVAYIDGAIAADASLAPDGNTMYLVYPPAGVSLDRDPGCTAPGHDAYHQPYGKGGDGWGVVDRCQGTFATQLEHLTIVGSHEIAEAATDSRDGWALRTPPTGTPPWEASPWLTYENGWTENGDFCIGTRIVEGGVAYQRAYSNAAALAGGDPCVPALPIPYYNVTTDPAGSGWFAGAPGETVTIPITGWSTGACADWAVTVAATGTSSDASLTTTATVASPTSALVGSGLHATINNGRAATVSVTIPQGAPPGYWHGFVLYSFRRSAPGQPPAGEDYSHAWRFGVYVPAPLSDGGTAAVDGGRD